MLGRFLPSIQTPSNSCKATPNITGFRKNLPAGPEACPMFSQCQQLAGLFLKPIKFGDFHEILRYMRFSLKLWAALPAVRCDGQVLSQLPIHPIIPSSSSDRVNVNYRVDCKWSVRQIGLCAAFLVETWGGSIGIWGKFYYFSLSLLFQWFTPTLSFRTQKGKFALFFLRVQCLWDKTRHVTSFWLLQQGTAELCF